MAETCTNCDAKITSGFSQNLRFSAGKVRIVNFIHGTSHEELCEKCGREIVGSTIKKLEAELERSMGYIKANIVDFPMMTISQVPPGAKCRIKAMVTANCTVGTGMFSEISQGFSDMFGMTNISSGMALKVNDGETAVRAIIANKAFAMGANCVIGVDIDYGVTKNNAATVNMQGTAVLISNLNEILDDVEFVKAQKIETAYVRTKELIRWLEGDFNA
ncbi:MAG: hypothetical protein JW395_3841 [Nitrospira sp.]|nr:hypothetical protein [Nitrospira sp.]